MKQTYLTWDDAPVIMRLDEVSALLRISRSSAYKLCHQPGFPVSHLGKRLVVEKTHLRKWIEMNTEKTESVYSR